MTDEELRQRVIEHDMKFQILTDSLTNLSADIKSMSVSFKNMAVLMEKFSNMEDNLKESFARVHKRISENEESLKTQEKKIENIHIHGCLKNSDNVKNLIVTRNWLIKIIVGAVVVSVMGIVLYKKSGG